MPVDIYGHQIGALYTSVPIRIAGVTFKNDRRSRQTILREIMWHDEPYSKTDSEVNLNFRESEFEGAPCIEIYVQNDRGDYEQLGFVPQKEVAFFVDNWDLYDSFSHFSVYGGKMPDGTYKNYGASLTLLFKNTPENQRIFDQHARAEEEEKRKQEEAEAPYKRAFELFCIDYPEITHGGFARVNTSEYISVNVLNRPRGRERLKPIYQVIYYPEEDTIVAFDHASGKHLPLRAHTHRTPVPKKSKKWIWVLVIFAIAALYFFRK